MILLSVVYIGYISQMSFYETSFQRRIEVINEWILLGMVYHWLAFLNPIIFEDHSMMKSLGESVISFITSLLGFNLLIIIWVNIKVVYAYCRRRIIKRKMQKKLTALKKE